MHVVMDLVQDSTDSKDGSVYDAATKLDRETQLKPSNLRHEIIVKDSIQEQFHDGLIASNECQYIGESDEELLHDLIDMVGENELDVRTGSEGCEQTTAPEKQLDENVVTNCEEEPKHNYISYQYDQNSQPQLVGRSLCDEFMNQRDNFFKGCKWSPDGTCLLTCNNDCRLRLFNLPIELYTRVTEKPIDMAPVLTVREGEIIYDYCWYPLMASSDPVTCCFLSCSRSAPVHMWDAYSSNLRASYVSYNHLDEVIAPYSVCFNNDGTKLFTGHRNSVKVFNTNRTGRDCETRPTYGKQDGGQAGIISTLASHPTSSDTFACGSYSCSVGLYSEQAKGPICVFSGLKSGVTHLKFSSCGNLLFSGERKSKNIMCWDLRNPGSVLFSLDRVVNTNQRIYFDVDRDTNHLLSGGTDGVVRWWNLSKCINGDNEQLCSKLTTHKDAVNGCSLHPFFPLMATSSGQWTFSNPYHSDSDEEVTQSQIFENSVKIWSLQGQRCGPYLVS